MLGDVPRAPRARSGRLARGAHAGHARRGRDRRRDRLDGRSPRQVDALRMCSADPIDFSPRAALPRQHGDDDVLIVWGGRRRLAAGRSDRPRRVRRAAPDVLQHAVIDWVTSRRASPSASPTARPSHRQWYCGLSTFGGSGGVGWATTRAVVNSSLCHHHPHAIISTASLMIFGRSRRPPGAVLWQEP